MMTKERIAELKRRQLGEIAIGDVQVARYAGELLDEIVNCGSLIESLQSRVAELEKDRVRLDWVEANTPNLFCLVDFDEHGKPGGWHWEIECRNGNGDADTFRAAIDAAMKGTNEH